MLSQYAIISVIYIGESCYYKPLCHCYHHSIIHTRPKTKMLVTNHFQEKAHALRDFCHFFARPQGSLFIVRLDPGESFKMKGLSGTRGPQK